MSLQYSEQTTAERDRTPSYVNSTAPLFIVPLTQITQGQRCTDAAPNIDGIMHGRIGLSTVSTRVTAVLHAPARLRPFGLARAVHGAVISWNEIHQGHHRFEAVLDLSPAGFVVTAAGIFHAVHVGGQPVTSRRAAGAAGKAAPQRSTAARMAMRLTAAAFVSLAIAKAVWMQTIKCCENRRAAADNASVPRPSQVALTWSHVAYLRSMATSESRSTGIWPRKPQKRALLPYDGTAKHGSPSTWATM
eukprot:s129_g36.t1